MNKMREPLFRATINQSIYSLAYITSNTIVYFQEEGTESPKEAPRCQHETGGTLMINQPIINQLSNRGKELFIWL